MRTSSWFYALIPSSALEIEHAMAFIGVDLARESSPNKLALPQSSCPPDLQSLTFSGGENNFTRDEHTGIA